MRLSEAAALFPGTTDLVYLNTAAEGLAPEGLESALARYVADKRAGSLGRPSMFAVEVRCRARVAEIMDVEPESIAFVASAARATNAVIASVRWASGDALVTTDLEFPTVDLASALLKERGVDVRVAVRKGGTLKPAAIIDLLDERVRLLAVSLVSFKSGAMVDLPAIAAATRAQGVPLLVDATQALGVVRVPAAMADFVVSSCYKWLLGPHGVAVLFVNPATVRDTRPDYVGWRSVRDLFAPDRRERIDWWPDARRFEEGMPPLLALYGLDAALEVLAGFEADEVANHARNLGARLIDGLSRLGIDPALLTPRAREQRAGIVSLADSLCERHLQELRSRGIEAWGRDHRLRVSMHLYNTSEDIDRLLEAMDDLGFASELVHQENA